MKHGILQTRKEKKKQKGMKPVKIWTDAKKEKRLENINIKCSNVGDLGCFNQI